MGSALLATLGVQAPLIFLVAFYGTQAGGIYALAARICAIPLALVANAVGQVFVAESAQLARTDELAVRPLFARTTRALARMAIGPALLAMVAAPLLAGPVFGADWAEAGLFVAILAPSYYLEFVMGATGDVLFVVERQDLHLVREIMRFTLIGLVIPLAAWLGLPTIGAVILLSAAGIANYLLYGLISWWAVSNFRPPRAGTGLTEAVSPAVDPGSPPTDGAR
jgi:O-antigen/teichoic acid export membrane protein